MSDRSRVVVIGGGISGLVAARRLSTSPGPRPTVTLLEAEPRLGGKVHTQELDGRPVDTGPDAVMLRVPAMRALIDELGLSPQVAAPAPAGTYLWSRGRLRRLPVGTLFGVPDRIGPLIRSRLLSPAGLLRAGADLVLPRTPVPPDPTVTQLLRPRLGGQVVERLVQPLVGGVHAGSTDELSATSAVPEIAALLRERRSIYRALRTRRSAPAPGPAMVSFTGGLRRLVDALAGDLADVEVRTSTVASAVVRADRGYRVVLTDGTELEADAVVLATPAMVSAGLLSDLLPNAATALAGIRYADVATVTLAYPSTAIGRELDANGFLVPPVEGRFLVGCTWLSSKWPALAGEDRVLIRAMVGRSDDRRWTGLDDDALVARVHGELAEAIGLTRPPTEVLVQRWPGAIPQYTVGHADRVAAIEAATAELPGLHLTGAAYHGAGVASCVADADRTADAVLTRLTALAATSGGAP